MDDLSGLSWSSGAHNSQKSTAPIPNFNALRPTPPVSGRSTPLPTHVSQPTSKPTTPANDSFSNLVSFTPTNPSSKNFSLLDQQKKLAEAKAQQEATRRKQQEAQYGSDNTSFWENLGSGRNTPAPQQGRLEILQMPLGRRNLSGQEKGASTNDIDEDDLLAGFRADAPVDSSTNFPKPSGLSPDLSQEALQRSHINSGGSDGGNRLSGDDDDPFGLSQLDVKPPEKHMSLTTSTGDEDDVLGLLGKPVSNFATSKPAAPPARNIRIQKDIDHPQDRAVAELVDMGFSPEQSRRALESTESGLDVQDAVGWLLNQAHKESRDNSRGQGAVSKDAEERIGRENSSRPRQRGESSESGPAWMRSRKEPESSTARPEHSSSGGVERDPSQSGSDLGATFMKTAGSIWKAGSRKVQKAVQDFNSDSDSNQPKWMKEPPLNTSSLDTGETPLRRSRSSGIKQPAQPVTNEALMLESDAGRPPRKPPRPKENSRLPPAVSRSRDHSPAVSSQLREEASPKPTFLRQQPTQSKNDIKSSLSRQAIEDDAAQAYVSSARRRTRPTPTSASAPVESDLLETSQATKASPSRSAVTSQKPSKSSTSIIARPMAPKRTIPPIDPSSLSNSHKHRLEGSSHFKRGDYSAAHVSYASALRPLPPNHPIVIILLTNRALTSLKVGEPKQAISDSDAAISLVGPSQGISESIDLQNGETPKPMRDFYGKALMRKAEALEQMERWQDAAAAWREAVSAGHGGATAIKGRERCEKAAKPIPVPRPASTPARKLAAAPKRPAISTITSNAAVSRLRAANAAAERTDDEKFALADIVDAKISTWKGGKADNLRALLGSLNTVLWPEAGWKKIGMAELVLPNKVKVQYMKGIAKVHPDKVSLGIHRWFAQRTYRAG